jgi:hypothetical protein
MVLTSNKNQRLVLLYGVQYLCSVTKDGQELALLAQRQVLVPIYIQYCTTPTVTHNTLINVSSGWPPELCHPEQNNVCLLPAVRLVR